MTTNYSQTYLRLSREQLIKKSHQLLQGILQYADEDKAPQLITTPVDYIGMDNMTIEQLRLHHTTLYNHYHSI